ncbi:peptidylprolyl isomerase [Halomonas sp. MCCC 1A17488]|uniref:SurA N-terminal domain-containing protein n=1 Tax=unclassified Halomonas TaxID=2609666 RepID=UPI0018D24C07|nr:MULTISPECIES: SurA N-terminal domain-containing protein [unclassified Halomonas]MCE8015231.1 peptidylprolyl isomerase [Halomonas sp. MCCC 1A17488]MCG3238564.1 peptidylprolyl isomerase [Halomonas sp. MCCC 1A17488]QPP47700.1 SurA N-terminal domain-containing protein [Halomonas sp. SS10-MC5]
MLQSIRDRSRSWGAKIIVAAVVVTMALFGIESLVGLFGGGGDEVAKVNGQTITRQELEMEVQRAIRSGQVPPEQERALRGQVLDEMIGERLLLTFAEDGGLYLSDEQLDQVIVTLPEFQDQRGRFDTELFRNRLASAGFTPNSFRAALRVDLKRQQLQQGLAVSDFVLDSEREALASLQRQVRSFRYYVLGAEELDEPVKVSDADLEAYYQENRERYQRPEQVRLEYVIVDRQQMAEQVDVDEEAIRQAWEERGRDADRRVSHIMVTFDGERSRDEAVARLEEVRERLADGESFEDLALQYSDDPSTAEQGGDLGMISRGFFGDAFDEAAFALSPGQVSGIVETDNGLHLVKVTELDQAPLEEVRDDLARGLALEQVNDEYNRRVQALIDESFAADDLASVADSLSLELHESDWVSRDGGDGVLSEPGVMSEAFSEDVLVEGFNSEVIELDEDRRMVLRVAGHREATVLPLDEVRERVAAAVEQRKQREALLDVARQRVERLRDGEELDLDWQQVEQATRQQDNVPRSVLQTAFRLPHPQGDEAVYGHTSDSERVTLIALDSVGAGETDEQTEAFVARMAQQLRAQAAIQGLRNHLRETAEIERY